MGYLGIGISVIRMVGKCRKRLFSILDFFSKKVVITDEDIKNLENYVKSK